MSDARGRGRGDRVRAWLGYRGRGTEPWARLRWALFRPWDGAGPHTVVFPRALGWPGQRGARLPARRPLLRCAWPNKRSPPRPAAAPRSGSAARRSAAGLACWAAARGLTSDQVVGAEVVLADGRVVECDEQRHEDLFWALRGAGALGLGVVTSLTLRTVPEPAATSFHVKWRRPVAALPQRPAHGQPRSAD